MASENFNHQNPGINLVPNTTTKVAVPGDMDYSSDTGAFNFFDASGAHILVTDSGTQTLTNKTIPIASNHITGTSNRAAQFNSITGDLQASSVTNTELGYVSGVTSSIQTQLNSKLTSFTIGALDSQAANANGLAFVGSVLSTQSADATHPGLVNNTTQSFSGNKTFTGTIGASNFSGTSSGTNTGDQTITLTGDVTGSGTGSFATTYNGTVPLNKGGSGQITANAALNAFLPSQGGNATKFLQTDGTNTSWQTASGGGSNPQIAYVSDVKSSGTGGGTFTSGAWRVRDLNTLATANSPSWISNNGTDTFTLTAGTYDFEISAPAYNINNHQIKLVNTTDTVDALTGTSEFSLVNGGGSTQSRSFINGSLVLSGTKNFQVQHRSQSTFAGSGFGLANFFGLNEVYTQVKITKIG